MAFQDFGLLSERRKAERKQKLKKRITIGVAVGFILFILVASGVMIVSKSKDNNSNNKNQNDGDGNGNGNGNKNEGESSSSNDIAKWSKAIKMICAPTDYRKACVSSLSKVENNSSYSASRPLDLLKAAITVIVDEVGKAVDTSSRFKFSNPAEKDAFEDCKVLLADAKEELLDSISQVGNGTNVKNLPTKSHDLNNWLSAVISYQQTCIDGFPDGDLKSKMQKTLDSVRKLTSNALAIVSEVNSFFSVLQVPGFGGHRRLMGHQEKLTTTTSSSSLTTQYDEDGLPIWMSLEHRRMLRGKGASSKPKPNAVVAKDGSGQFKTISEALLAMPKAYTGRYVIYVKQGMYDETVTVTKNMVNVTMYGDGSRKTIVTGNKNFVDGVRTFQTASFVALGEGFIGQAMGFRNTAGPQKHQAVALRVQADRSIFLNCRMEGYQDTLYAQTHRQFYKSCVISGTVDFIFGDATAIFQNCLILIRKPLDNQQNIVTAQGRVDKRETTGIVLQNCRIQPDTDLEPVKANFKNYLGRPWKEYSRTIVMESTIGDLIHPDGWLPWQGDFALNTLFYAEYNNKGPGASLSARVKWPGYKVITKKEAQLYTVEPFLQSNWIKATGTPVKVGFFA
ncbi:putative pectinesterase/pectinesterase inhibitor 45 [Telopea speciosissima]|uniref:putative pectinesterase/pectinesterase inhibitor 45 n=1 Tax=Telopea speciosissima TaxID=54955 RepID=UPI001CC4864C|nr:putative pectinesterase/pectinesterase inhibitor 45 [Telopea speciosissima]